MLSLAKEQLCNPSQITFCCSGMREGIWDSCLLNYCSLKAACPPWWLLRALAGATQGGWGCCPLGAPMSPCASSTEGHVAIGTGVSWWCTGASGTRIMFFVKMFTASNAQLHSPRLGLSTWFMHCGGWWHPGPASASWMNWHCSPAQSSWWNVTGFHTVMDS